MMSQTHLLVASGLFAKPGHRLRNAAVLMGAFIPDIAIYGLFVWSKLNGIPEQQVWRELYWQEPWQTYTAAGNSILLFLALLIAGFFALRNAPALFQIGVFLVFFALAALTHIGGDLPVHVEDAHRHLWPVSDWKFISPVSYWNPEHHGHTFMLFEIALAVFLCIVLYRRFRSRTVRALLLLLLAAYIAVPLYFKFAVGGV